jgi:hypothetical protein
MNLYEIGTPVILRASFKNAAGEGVDPSALKVSVKDPIGAETEFTFGTDAEVIKESEGNYRMRVDPALQGVWVAKWLGTGANAGAKTDKFQMVEDFFD